MMKLTPRTRQGSSSRNRPHGINRAASHDEDESARTIVGFSHVLLGAVGLTAAGVGLLFSAHTPLLVGILLARVTFELATCYAGLLIKDGQRKGAFVALVTGALRTAMLLAAGSVGVMLVGSVVLIGAAGWLLPTLASGKSDRTTT